MSQRNQYLTLFKNIFHLLDDLFHCDTQQGGKYKIPLEIVSSLIIPYTKKQYIQSSIEYQSPSYDWFLNNAQDKQRFQRGFK